MLFWGGSLLAQENYLSLIQEKIRNGEIDASTTIESYSNKLKECNKGHKLEILEKKPFKYPSVICDKCRVPIQTTLHKRGESQRESH